MKVATADVLVARALVAKMLDRELFVNAHLGITVPDESPVSPFRETEKARQIRPKRERERRLNGPVQLVNFAIFIGDSQVDYGRANPAKPKFRVRARGLYSEEPPVLPHVAP